MRSDGDPPMGPEIGSGAAPAVGDLRAEALLYLEWVRGASGRFATRERRPASPSGIPPVAIPAALPPLPSLAPLVPPVRAPSSEGGPDPEEGPGEGVGVKVSEATRVAPASLAVSADVPTGPADGADGLSGLADEAAACRRCPLAATRRSVVFGEGPSRPRLLLIGEAPTAEEDALGRPFVGSVGDLLDRMLAAIGLTRSEVYVTNVVKCCPVPSRPPTAEEVAACRPYLDGQIAALRPELVLLLGPVATRAVLRTDRGLADRRGVLTTTPTGVPALSTYHPEYLERNPAVKGVAWDDLQFVATTLGLTIPPRSGRSRSNPNE